ncbi:hypothetical protein BJX63DRAFT_444084 [Aspergillus granulosus]|uniref:Uncharacterized protein n=1 Tax=Aspergillus granulosus TaxID=176169 RepID=A0ABR4H7W2_9EURO
MAHNHSSPAASSSGKQDQYQCDICCSSFRRPDHLARHYRAHTKQRPFVCPVCSKGFARRDLMTRHKAKHIQDGQYPASQQPLHYRVAQACKRCAASKLKCTDEKPCPRCVKRNLVCETADGSTLRKPPAQPKIAAEPTVATMVGAGDGNGNGDDDPIHVQPDNHDQSMWADDALGSDPTISTPIMQETELAMLNNPLSNSGLWTIPSLFGGEQQPSATASADEDLAFLQQLDFSFLDQITAGDGLDLWLNPPVPIMPHHSQVYRGSSVVQTWVPLPTENSGMERANLALTGDSVQFRGTAESGAAVFQHYIGNLARDRMLNMVFMAYSDKTAQIVETFPSAEILSRLVFHFVSQRRVQQIIDFVHLPTFNWKNARPELLAAVIALSAVDGPSPAVRKFGYALQATVRRATIQRYEEDYAKMRDMDLAQAYLIQQYIAFFSGIPLKIGLAESCYMITSTIISQARVLLEAFAESPSLEDAAMSTDSAQQLNQLWRRWSQQESIRRLIYYSFSLDCRVSITRNLNPILPYINMDTAMPCPERFWKAGTAASWKTELLNRSRAQSRAPSLRELLQSPRLLSHCSDQVDAGFAGQIYISGLWSLVREYRHLSGIVGSGSGSSSTWNTLVLKSRHEELNKALERFDKESAAAADHHNAQPQCPQVSLLNHLTAMHLHVSFKDLQAPMQSAPCSSAIFVQQETQSSAYAYTWMQSPESRSAIWHAGQAIRAATAFPAETLGGFYSICLLQATVVLWVYGNLSLTTTVAGRTANNAMATTTSTTGSTTHRIPPPPLHPVYLNDADHQQRQQTAALDAFLDYGEGQPGLLRAQSDEVEFVPLTKPKLVAEMVLDILRQNWQQGPFFPSGTDEVVRVLGDFCTCGLVAEGI